MNKNILNVTSSHGFLLTLEYINMLRLILKNEPMTEAEYDTLSSEALAAGRDAVIAAHRESLDNMAFGKRG